MTILVVLTLRVTLNCVVTLTSLSPFTSQQAPSIQRNSCTINKTSTLATQPQTSPCHILRFSDPAQRDTSLNTVPVFLQRRLHHLTLKRTTRNRIARDVPPSQMQAKHATEMMQTRFAGGIGKGFESRDP